MYKSNSLDEWQLQKKMRLFHGYLCVCVCVYVFSSDGLPLSLTRFRGRPEAEPNLVS